MALEQDVDLQRLAWWHSRLRRHHTRTPCALRESGRVGSPRVGSELLSRLFFCMVSPTRGADAARQLLRDFGGSLVSDAYSAYGQLAKEAAQDRLDIGVPCPSPCTTTAYGDWGGHGRSTAITDACWDDPCSGSEDPDTYHRYNCADEGPDDCDPFDSESEATGDALRLWVRANNQQEVRRNLFRYAMMTPRAVSNLGGQAWRNRLEVVGLHSPELPFSVRQRQLKVAHELGHTLGLFHCGAVGDMAIADGNCRVNYPSLMNYAHINYDYVGFSDGSFPALDPHDLDETTGVPGWADVVEELWHYPADPNDATNSRVDWNLDGDWDDADVRASIRYRGAACETVGEHRQDHEAGARQSELPAAVSSEGKLWVLARAVAFSDLLAFTFESTMVSCPPGQTTHCCPSDLDQLRAPCGAWTDADAPPDEDVDSAPAAIPWADGDTRIRYFYTSLQDPNELRTNTISDTGSYGVASALPLAAGVVPAADDEEDLTDGSNLDAIRLGADAFVAFRNESAEVFVYRLDPSFAFAPDGGGTGVVIDPAAVPPGSLLTAFAQSLAIHPTTGNVLMLVGAPDVNPNRDATLRLFERTSAGSWAEVDLDSSYLTSDGGPATLTVETAVPPKLAMWHIPRPDNPVDRYLHATVDKSMTFPDLTLWRTTQPLASDEYFGGGVRTVLHNGARVALAVLSDVALPDGGGLDGYLRMWPFSDGVPPVQYPDSNDADTIARRMCALLCDDDEPCLESCPVVDGGGLGPCLVIPSDWEPYAFEEFSCEL